MIEVSFDFITVRNMTLSDLVKFFEFPGAYLLFAAVCAGAFYRFTLFSGKHLSSDARARMSLWLQGEFRATWATQFCLFFDSIFGASHFTIKCFRRSALFSVFSVLMLYVLFTMVLGVIGTRTDGSITPWRLLITGAVINIVPDYFSLFQTRWIIKRFEKIKSLWGQSLLLLVDAVLSGAIILICIYLFQHFTDAEISSWVELVAIFSVYSLFFYSTFFTSAWAWIFFLSRLFIDCIHKLKLSFVFDFNNNPIATFGMFGAAIIFIFSLALTPIFRKTDDSQNTPKDMFLCEKFPAEACKHNARRITKDEILALEYLTKACIGGDFKTCEDVVKSNFLTDPGGTLSMLDKVCRMGEMDACAYGGTFVIGNVFFDKPNFKRGMNLLTKSCAGKSKVGCRILGNIYEDGVEKEFGFELEADPPKAVKFWEKACNLGDASACDSLADLYASGEVVEKNEIKSIKLYKKACDGGSEYGCYSLAHKYRRGTGVVRDDVLAAKHFKFACDNDLASGCGSLALQYALGEGVEKDEYRAIILFKKGCNGGSANACYTLAIKYEFGESVEQNTQTAIGYYEQACLNGRKDENCNNVSQHFKLNDKDDHNWFKAATIYQKRCDDGDPFSCYRLGTMYDKGYDIWESKTKAAWLFRKACEGGDEYSCYNVGHMMENGDGVPLDRALALSFYQKACDGGDKDGCRKMQSSD